MSGGHRGHPRRASHYREPRRIGAPPRSPDQAMADAYRRIGAAGARLDRATRTYARGGPGAHRPTRHTTRARRAASALLTVLLAAALLACLAAADIAVGLR